jgi:two-component system OmpR family response regulator
VPRILVVDSEPAVTGLVTKTLSIHGFDVVAARSGGEAVAAAAGGSFRPDLVIVSAALPDDDGLDVLRRLRDEAPAVGAIVLTGEDCTEERVRALVLGGDDCLGKPFDVEELVARVGAVLRRTSNGSAATSRLAFADLELDESTREVWRAGELVRLTATEFNVLRYLVLNQGIVVSKSQILDRLWRHDFTGDDNVVETYISYIRRKLDRSRTQLIHTVRGAGYVLRLPD